MMLRIVAGLLLSVLLPGLAQAWWNDKWTERTQVTLNTGASGVETKEMLTKAPILVRLHEGNFDFLAAKDDGSDLRFVAGDEKTVLKHHVEKWDAVNGLALVWVQVPALPAGAERTELWLYYGNAEASPEADAAGSYDGNFSAVFHFNEAGGAPQDLTSNRHHAAESTATRSPGTLIGDGAALDGSQRLVLAETPALKLAAGGGFSFSAWVNPGSLPERATLLSWGEGTSALVIGFAKGALFARVSGTGAAPVEAQAGSPLVQGAWQHLAVTLSDRLVLYVDGKEAAAVPVRAPALAGPLTIGAAGGGAIGAAAGYVGKLDELQLSNVARSADWIRVSHASQAADGRLVATLRGEAAEAEGGHSYFGILIANLTTDAWAVIIVLLVMFVVAVVVMVTKAQLVSRTDRDNRRFLHDFRAASGNFLQMGERHGHAGSSLFRLYQAGTRELAKRFDANGGPQTLSGASINAIKAAIDADMVRETHRLNSQMVLLTIAISGGPFLGLLGTVVGVMITFAAIAAAGDVNVNAIAPGIAAALLATVAGLAVAIPALFGYNYLASRIKNISADMQIFVDELVTRIAEVHAAQ